MSTRRRRSTASPVLATATLLAATAVLAGVTLLVTGSPARGTTAARSHASRPVLGPGAVTVRLDVRRSRFHPARIRVVPHTDVTFEVVNHDVIDHELIVGGDDVHARHETGHEAVHAPTPGEVSVAPHTTGVTTYSFHEPGPVRFACHLPGHFAYGMRGTVTVVPPPGTGPERPVLRPRDGYGRRVDPLHDALARFTPHDATEAADVARLRAVLDGGDAWSRDLRLHATASALVVHPPTRRVLLRHHTRMGGWFQVGGHGDPGEVDPWAVALREAEEETGLRDLTALSPALDRRPLQVVVVPVPAAKGEPDHAHADVRYVLATATPDAARAEAADAPVRWFSFAEARAVVHEANLRTFLERVERALDTEVLT